VPRLARSLTALALVSGCGGSGLSSPGSGGSEAPWTVGTVGEANRVSDAGDTPRQDLADGAETTDASTSDAKTDAVESVPAPDGFPGPDGGACVEGQPCAVVLSEPCLEGRCSALGTCVAVSVVGCCEGDDDCAGVIAQDACDLPRCVSNTCVLVTRPGCCSAPEVCDDDEICTSDSCLGGPGGQCASCPTNCACPDTAPLAEAHFDGQSLLEEGFGIDDQQSDTVSWRLSTRRAVSPPSAAWLGEIDCPTYYSGALGPDCQPTSAQGADGGAVRVKLVGPAVALPASPGGHVASFWLWSDVEPLGSGGAGERDVLTLSVHDVSSGAAWPIASSLWVGKNTRGQWRQMAVDLSPWMGTTISLRFLFDTLDSHDNHHEGVYLDDVVIQPRCGVATCCDVDADCQQPAGADPCVSYRCLDLADGSQGACLHAPVSPGAPCTSCGTDSACADGNPCTDDLCSEDGICTHTAFCCVEIAALSTGFEAGLVGWYVLDDQPEDAVTWRTSETDAVEGIKAAWLGDPLTGTYASTGAVRATLRSPSIALPDGGDDVGEAAVRFALSLSTEWDGEPYDNLAGVDRLSLTVSAGAGPGQEVWSSDEIGGTTQGAWTEIEVSLAPWTGQSIQLAFTFDTVDEAANDHAGPRIDDVRVGHVCP